MLLKQQLHSSETISQNLKDSVYALRLKNKSRLEARTTLCSEQLRYSHYRIRFGAMKEVSFEGEQSCQNASLESLE